MSQNRVGKWARRAVWTTLAAVFTLGCSPLSTIAFIFGDDPTKPAEYPLTFKDGPKKGKEVVVAVFISSAPGIGQPFAGSEGKLAYDIAKKLPEMAKLGKTPQKLVVLEPSLVNKFKMDNPTWKQGMHPSEWGRKLHVDFVIDIQLESMSLYQPGSLNQLYEGQADVTVDVYDVDVGPGEPKYNYVLPFKYPHTHPLAVDNIPQNRFKQDFLEHLAAEISMKHIEHKISSGIADDK
jgi:hypothetical protein